MSNWHRYEPERRRLTVHVHVQPNAASSAVAGLHGDAVKIRIAAPAIEDRANRALVAFLHDVLRVRRSQISIRRGRRGQRKTIEIAEADPTVADRLAALL